MGGSSGRAFGPRPSTDPSKWTDLLTWLAGGFTLLAGVAAFFGMKDGVLARVVRLHPQATIAVFLFVGLAVVLALFAPALVPGRREADDPPDVPGWVLVTVIGALVVSAVLVTPDLPGVHRFIDSWWGTAGVVVAFVVLAAVVAAWGPRHRIGTGWQSAAVVVAVVSLGCGLYTSVKLAVLEKVGLQGAVVVSQLSTADGRTSVTLKASGTEVAGPVRIRIVGWRHDGGDVVQLGEELLAPARSGAIEADVAVPVRPGPWTSLQVLTCQEWNTAGGTTCSPWHEQARFALAPTPGRIGGQLSLSEDTKTLTASVQGAGFAAGDYVQTTLVPLKPSSNKITARVGTAADGSITWTTTTPVSVGGTAAGRTLVTWELRGAACRAGDDGQYSCDQETQLATLRIGP